MIFLESAAYIARKSKERNANKCFFGIAVRGLFTNTHGALRAQRPNLQLGGCSRGIIWLNCKTWMP